MDFSGLYDDTGLAGLPQTIAAMGLFTLNNDTVRSNKRSRSDISSSSSGGEGSSVDDKKMLERERNRLHARRSRARKKQCMEKLQEQLNQLHQETEEVKASDEEEHQKLRVRHDAWRHALRKVFDLRTEGCTDEDTWLEVLSPDVCLTMPITPYRSFNPADIVNHRRVLLGVDGMISDTQSLQVLRDNIGIKKGGREEPVNLQCLLGSDSDGAFFNENGLMCTFLMRTLDAMVHGALSECEKNGMIRVCFDGDDKIEELDITFDPIAFHHQLMRAKGQESFPLVPTSLAGALRDENSRIVVTTAKRPFRITHVNKAWTDLCGFEIDECHSKSLSILQGPETDMAKVADLCKLSQKGYAASMVVTNHNKKGELFRNHLRCYPVTSDDPGELSHIVGVLNSIPNEKEESSSSHSPTAPTIKAC